MTTINEQNTIERENNILENALLQVTRTEFRKAVTERRSQLVDALFDAGVGTIYDVYEQLHIGAQSVGGYVGAIVRLLDNETTDRQYENAIANLCRAMNDAARSIGKEESFTPEHAAQSAAKSLDNLLFGVEVAMLAQEKPDIVRIVGVDNWQFRVRHAIEVKTGYVKQTERKTANRAVSKFGYSALVAARQAYFAK